MLLFPFRSPLYAHFVACISKPINAQQSRDVIFNVCVSKSKGVSADSVAAFFPVVVKGMPSLLLPLARFHTPILWPALASRSRRGIAVKVRVKRGKGASVDCLKTALLT
jgi:hypothetical protein